MQNSVKSSRGAYFVVIVECINLSAFAALIPDCNTICSFIFLFYRFLYSKSYSRLKPFRHFFFIWKLLINLMCRRYMPVSEPLKHVYRIAKKKQFHIYSFLLDYIRQSHISTLLHTYIYPCKLGYYDLYLSSWCKFDIN